MKAGDVVLRFDGKDIPNVRALPRIVARTAHGKTVTVDVLRKGEPLQLNVVVGRLQEGKGAKKDVKKSEKPGDKGETQKVVLGMTLSPLNEELRKKYKLGRKVRGLVVEAVAAKSDAAKKDVKAGDVIVEAE